MSAQEFETVEETFGGIRLVPVHVVARLCNILIPRGFSMLMPAVLTVYALELTEQAAVVAQLQAILKLRKADDLLPALVGLHDYHRRLMTPPQAESAPIPADLTAREVQVLVGMSQGKSNGEIGRELYLTEDTIKTHARRMFRKLGAHDRAHAVTRGYDCGILPTAAAVL